MKKYKKEVFYYCPLCKEAQEFVPNPMYMHICTDCKQTYSNRKLIMKVEKVRII
jgi:hypothetical protein